MASIKRGARVASILVLVSIIASACNQPYSQSPSSTNTPINPDSLFATPIGGPTDMTDVQIFATGTSVALTGTAVPALVTQTPEGGATQTASPTPLVALNPTFTATATLAVSGTLATALPPGTPPPTHVLQKGEWPYCIARRLDVNPEELISLNGLTRGDIYYPNLTLKIPQTGNHFPPPRAFRTHPTTYTVSASDQTVAGVACLFGDVYPSAIAQANGISESAAVTVGQVLSIP